MAKITAKRHCSVRGCKNYARPGSTSCGKHVRAPRRAARATGGRTRFVHLDCRVSDLLIELEPLAPADVVTIEVRDNSTLVGLPTNRPQMLAFLRDWLLCREHTLDLLERLTPAQLRPCPLMANAYAAAADRLVRYDLAGGAASHQKRGIVS
jgi:hypothetical protein